MPTTIGKRLLSSALRQDLAGFLDLRLNEDLFVADESDIYGFIRGHVEKFGAVPHPSTIEAQFGALPEAPEPAAYYLDRAEERQTHQGVKKTLLESDLLLQEGRSYEARDLILERAMQMSLMQHRSEIFDYAAQGADIIADEYKKKLTLGDDYGVRLGWPSFDNMSGGLHGGDVVVVAGRPASGKSYKTLYSALNVWKQGKVPLLVSMEMKPLLVMQRAAAIHASKPITKLKQGTLSSKSYKGVIECLEDAQTKQPFWVVDGNMAANVSDVVVMARQLKPDVVIIDGAYLMQHTEARASNWEKVKGVIEGLKRDVAEGLNLPLVANYQLSRNASHKSKKESAGLEDLAYSDAIGQIASIVLGLTDEETVENLMRKRVQILKGRSGEMGEYWVNWIFDNFGPNGFMDFSETEKVDIMEYV